MSADMRVGDCLEVLRTMPDESVQCCVTSPPYFGLRDYGHAGQLGLEKTPELYVEKMVAVFREVRRVLRDDGTLWLNIGDSYAGSGKAGNPEAGKQATNKGSQTIGVLYETGKTAREAAVTNVTRHDFPDAGIKAKDLIGIPWMLAFALRADGWYLRSDIIWHKPNPMPESVTDRPTKAHEYLFLLTKSARYYYDAAAIREPLVKGDAGSRYDTGKTAEHQLGRASTKPRRSGNKERKFRVDRGGNPDLANAHQGFGVPWEDDGSGRNRRSVWTITTQPFKEAHFAVMPPKLVEPCILAGCPVGGTVLDPFAGAGTVGLVASRLGRSFIGIELNPKYAEMARQRIYNDAPLFSTEPAA